jgi:hypothetical protein
VCGLWSQYSAELPHLDIISAEERWSAYQRDRHGEERRQRRQRRQRVRKNPHDHRAVLWIRGPCGAFHSRESVWNPCEYNERRRSHQSKVLDSALSAKVSLHVREPRTKLLPLDEGTTAGVETREAVSNSTPSMRGNRGGRTAQGPVGRCHAIP